MKRFLNGRPFAAICFCVAATSCLAEGETVKRFALKEVLPAGDVQLQMMKIGAKGGLGARLWDHLQCLTLVRWTEWLPKHGKGIKDI